MSTLQGWLAGTSPLPLIGHALAMKSDPLRLFVDLARTHGPVAPLRFGPRAGHLVSEPSLVEEVLVMRPERYHRRTRVYQAMIEFLGASILTTEGDDWKKHRRIVQPAFHKRRLAAFTDTITRITDQHLSRWSGELDVSEAMMHLTLEIVSETLLGIRTDDHAAEIGAAVAAGQRYAESVMSQFVSLPKRWPTPQRRQVDRTLATIDRLAYGLIDGYQPRDDATDAVGMLLEARYDDGSPLSRERIRNELITLLVAGHETTSNALAWCFMRLSQHPDVARRLRAEVDAVLDGRPPAFEDVGKLRYARWVLDESMRLHPPVWATGRVARVDHQLGGQPVARHDLIVLSPWVTHRRPDLWDNAEGFDPDRWRHLSGREALPPFTFFPFGGGRRKCVGEAFAYLEAIAILAMVMQRLDLQLLGRPIVPLTQITLGFARGLWMTAQPRAPQSCS